jgi:hypothetical protein
MNDTKWVASLIIAVAGVVVGIIEVIEKINEKRGE